MLVDGIRACPASTAKIYLDLSLLDEDSGRAWRDLVDLAVRAVGIAPALVSFEGIPLDDGHDFAFVADSVAISRKLLLNVPCLYVQPHSAPLHVDPFFHCEALACGLLPRTLRAERGVTLVSSVFRGDEFLDGFLGNMAALRGYAECEHLLIRAGSPGDEHRRLVEHVRRCPGAVYVNLAKDPGLYEVWNLGARLATGRYLSNANIDDRRAPEQISKLQAKLDAVPEISVASASLRVSTQKNLPWADSGDCPLMFADTAEQVYSASSLFKHTREGLASRNLPHCMPLWRRHLHVFLGDFDEKRYGPSADWAFWLRAGRRGVKFYFSNEPLGLYLRDEGTYWRRNKDSARFDDRIAAEFGDLAAGDPEGGQHKWLEERPLSLELSNVIKALRHGAMLDGIGRLLTAVSAVELSPTAGSLIEKICRRFFGCIDGLEWVSRFRHGAGMQELPETALFNALADLIHGFDPVALGDSATVVRRNLAMACVDWHECFADGRGLLLLALLARRSGDPVLELRLLRFQHDVNQEQFWLTVQSVYRFSRPLRDLCADLPTISPKLALHAPAGNYHLTFYPDYRRGNAYQRLLYEPLTQAGGEIRGVSDELSFMQTEYVSGKENVLHIHWLNGIMGQTGAHKETVIQRIGEFLDGLNRAKKNKFKIYWTIHNNVSHECAYPEIEIDFHKNLYHLADKVFVHHPLVASIVDWLPDKHKLCLCEHGHYDIDQAAQFSQSEARSVLGLSNDDFVVTHVGKIRDYKGLASVLPVLMSQLDATPNMKLIIAGKINSNETKKCLANYSNPRLIVRNDFLTEEEIILNMRAADVGFLSYSSILTSGSLFHWMTCARPVLAPSMGTIPCYLIDGWNGLAYGDGDCLQKRLSWFASLPKDEILRLGRNALQGVRQLEWNLWNI
jgi:glycosyltransferase involved in cell wall biosynthesis